MKKVAEESPGKVMTPEARNLFSVAYKNVVGARRSAWRVVNSLAEKAGDDNKVPLDYRKRIEEELKKECEEVLVSGLPLLDLKPEVLEWALLEP